MIDWLDARIETWPIAGRFTISRGSKTEAVVVVATIRSGDFVGRAECVPYARYGESAAAVEQAINEMATALKAGMSRQDLQTAMKPGAARNAIDCAMVDLEAKMAGAPAHVLLGLPAPKPVVTAYTLGVDTPDAMAAAALRMAHRPLLKIKLAGEGDEARMLAIRAAVPNAALIADANEAWTAQTFARLIDAAVKARISLIEQPLPAADDAALRDLPRAIPICADESAHASDGLSHLLGLYDAVNIKLDKTGGITEAVQMVRLAKASGLKIMVGCMVGTSLSMAPAMLIAGEADYVDLDGPLLLEQDRENGLHYDEARVSPPISALWG